MKYSLPGGKCRCFRTQKVRFIKEKNKCIKRHHLKNGQASD